MPTVLIVIEPRDRMSDKDEIPDTKEKNTSGTTINFNKFKKMSPPRLKIYS